MEVNSVARFGRMVYLVGDGLSLELRRAAMRQVVEISCQTANLAAGSRL